MEMWFSDIHTDGVKLSIRIEEQLFSSQSEVQRIDVLESKDFGKILVVDGDLMLTERDEFIYHEMITHVPMAVHPDVKEVLVVGGGDGGVVRELIKYDTIEKIDVVEPDPLLVEVCRKYIPEIAASLTDERVQIFHEDGVKFIRSKGDAYDLIIIDSPNPFGAGEGLFTKEFYGNRMRVRFIQKRLSSARGCTRESWRRFRSAGFTRRISPLIRRDTGCSDSPQRNIIRWMIWTKWDGNSGASVQNTTSPGSMRECSRFRSMWKNCLRT